MKLTTVRYLGFTAMDRRFSDAMLPWIVSEIRKRDSKEQVSLGAEDGTLQGYNTDFELQFSHKIQDISKFSQADTDPCAFLYLVTDEVDRLLYCYMFQATQPSDVSDLYQQIREQSSVGPTLTSLCGDISPSSSHFFEVLYVGKIKVSHRKVPETFIDDALDKFKNHELARRASYDSQASTDSSVAENVSDGAEGAPQGGKEPTGALQEAQKATQVGIHSHDHNRTMVLQVGRSDLRLISPDRKQVLLHRYHRDVLTCVQGSKSPENFGFVCRENHQKQPETIQNLLVGYVFKCESSSVANDAVGAISQAANAPSNQKMSEPNFTSVTTCEHCPMLWYHKLCADVEGLGERKTQATIFRRIEQLEETEQSSILTKFRGAETDSLRDQNEFLMMLLRAHSEMKQNRHVHDTIENRSEFLNHYLGSGNNHPASGTIFMKAKRSLSSSFEHLLKRKGSRDDFGMGLSRDLSLPLAKEGSPTDRATPAGGHSPAVEVQVEKRSRSATIGSQADLGATLSPEKGALAASPKSPMMDIFMKVGNSPRTTPSSGSASSDSAPESRGSTPRASGSWRQAIFNRVVTPNKVHQVPGGVSGAQRGGAPGPSGQAQPRAPRTSEDLRELWKRAIKQAVLLVRMEKENARLRARQEVSAMKRVKLEYDELSLPNNNSSLPLWDMLTSGSSTSDPRLILTSAARGVPSARRGEVWQRLASLYTTNRAPPDITSFPNYDVPYEQLLKQLTAHQHAILIDLGRTFPNHPYFKAPLGPGQLSLFNLLKAYSLLDPEVGYCQGLSFVAGVLLLHMEEAEAFKALKHLMFRRSLRAHYLPDMAALQVRLYQLSRLLHDRLPELYQHLDSHEVSPTLYAAPWMLTIFASQFPLGFVARVFDVLFAAGADIVFRVAMALLGLHQEQLMKCESFEQIMEYLKGRVTEIDAQMLDKVMSNALSASNDVTQRLNEYKVEYQVLQEEANSSRPHLEELERLRVETHALMERNNALAAQLEISLSNVQRLERTRTLQQSAINRLETQCRTLEVSVTTLGTFIDGLVEHHVDVNIPGDVRRIVAQLMVGERRRTDTKAQRNQELMKTISNSANLFRRQESDEPEVRKPPNRIMVKSLSTGRISLNGGPNSTGGDAAQRSVSLQSASDLERELRLGHHRGVPLRVIDDESNQQSKQNLGSKVSHFFSNTHSHILRQHRGPTSPPPASPPQVIREESREDMSPTEEQNPLKISLDLRTEDTSPSESVDSGVGSPPGAEPHPLSGCDVSFTYNGTTKLKNIRNIRSLSRNSSPDLLGK